MIDAAQSCPCTRRQFCKSNIPLIFVNDEKERRINFPPIQVYRQGILDTGQIIVLLWNLQFVRQISPSVHNSPADLLAQCSPHPLPILVNPASLWVDKGWNKENSLALTNLIFCPICSPTLFSPETFWRHAGAYFRWCFCMTNESFMSKNIW